MKLYKLIFVTLISTLSFSAIAQVESAGSVRKKIDKGNKENNNSVKISDKFVGKQQTNETHEADLSYMKEIYRNLDLEKGPNAALYYPEDVIEGKENLFRLIFNLVLDGQIPAYEYLDGKEIFSDQYKMNVKDILERFDIYAQEVKGSTEKNPKYIIEESDVPTGLVKNYYIIEKWEFDRRSSSMKTKVEAICPVISTFGDYGDLTKYPMFWIKMESLSPYLSQQYVSIDDDNNLPQYTLNDFFTMNLYDGEIYKIRNLRNLTMAQMYPDEDDLRRAQDSIDNKLRNYGKDLWVPSREEYLSMKEAQKKGENDLTEVSEEEIPEKTSLTKTTSSRSKKKKSTKKIKASQSSGSSAEKSVRRRKK